MSQTSGSAGMKNGRPEPRDASRMPARSKNHWVVTVPLVFAVLLLIPSMLGFVMKFRELWALSSGQAGMDGGFAITPVVNYLLASLGFLCLLLWAALNGMFRDLEKPKYAMLENEWELDRNE
ncbi:MAG: cbb3-type cytochrome oxidase assembly protein [Planctomycetaceae bacterium]|nr:cbb3-type cytochrome oxidase assembly protein [Planctomycetaceae bacterium]